MKFKISGKGLSEACKTVLRYTTPRYDRSDWLVFETIDDDKLVIYANNSEYYVEVTVLCQVIEPGRVVVSNSDRLSRLDRNDEEIACSIKGNSLEALTNTGSVKLPLHHDEKDPRQVPDGNWADLPIGLSDIIWPVTRFRALPDRDLVYIGDGYAFCPNGTVMISYLNHSTRFDNEVAIRAKALAIGPTKILVEGRKIWLKAGSVLIRAETIDPGNDPFGGMVKALDQAISFTQAEAFCLVNRSELIYHLETMVQVSANNDREHGLCAIFTNNTEEVLALSSDPNQGLKADFVMEASDIRGEINAVIIPAQLKVGLEACREETVWLGQISAGLFIKSYLHNHLTAKLAENIDWRNQND